MTLGYRYPEEGTGNGEAWTGTRGLITLVPVPEELFLSYKDHNNN